MFKCPFIISPFDAFSGDVVFRSERSAFTRFVFSFCQTNTLWTIAQPQNIIPTPMNTDVTMAGVEWNWMNVYRIMPGIRKKIINVCFVSGCVKA